MSTREEVLEEWRLFRDRYIENAELFVREVLKFPNERDVSQGWDIHPWQKEILAEYSRRRRRISIRSGHRVGKTTLLAWVALHHILFRFPQKTAVTAPSEKQLFNGFWAEFGKWLGRLPEWLQERIEIKSDRAELRSAPKESFISIATARPEQPEALQGAHSEYSLLIADEASAVDEKVFVAAGSVMANPHAVLILASNPTKTNGYFYESQTRLKDKWCTKHVSCFECPTTAGKEFAEEVADTWGIESNHYRVRVLGEFPRADDDTIIPYELAVAAIGRDVVVSPTEPVIWGLDVARYGDDRTCLAKRRTRELMEKIKWLEKKDLMETAGWVKHEWDITPGHERPQVICIDTIGLGSGVFDRLRELGLPVRAVNVSESPAATNAEKFANLTTELMYEMRNWFVARDCKLPEYYARPDRANNLISELCSRKYQLRDSSGKVEAESKAMMKKRGMRSPDLADALMLTFAVEAATLAQGRYRSMNWRTKISRPLKGIV
jgi:hypothetical protein